MLSLGGCYLWNWSNVIPPEQQFVYLYVSINCAPLAHRTPLHCAASCNDRPLCEFLVRNGAAVMAMTHSDGATASQKCDPYAIGFEECENFLRGEETSQTRAPAHTLHTHTL